MIKNILILEYINSILKFIEQLNELNIKNIEPLSSVFEQKLFQREDVVKKILNGELPENMSEETIQEKYLKGCEWVKEVDESVLREELSDCPEYKIRDNIINK